MIGTRELAARVGFLLALLQAAAATVVAEHWNPADLDLLARGRSQDGRALPSNGYMAMRRLGWTAAFPDDVYVCDRVRRCAEEEAARALRLALHRRAIVEAILATWPADPRKRTDAEWTALRAMLPDGVTAAEIRNRTRQIQAILDPGDALPGCFTEAEDAPVNAPQALLAAADRQLLTLTRTGQRTAELRLQLPVQALPSSRKTWAWHVIPITLPAHVPADAQLSSPTLRIKNGRICVDLPFTVLVPFAPSAGHTTGISFDWGVNTLLTGTVGRLVGGRVETDGRPLAYDASAISAKLHRLRGHREHLAAKRTQYAKLLAPLTDGDSRRAELLALHKRADLAHSHACARIRNLNDALAWGAARWAVDQAVAAAVTVIYLEDLATLEARGTRRGNARLSGQVRGTVVEAIRHLAAKEQIAVVTVPARGTSKYCPRCGNGKSELTHIPAPDRLGERGWKWAHCRKCGLSCDRDWAAAERIVARGLLAQENTWTERKTGKRVIRTVIEGNVSRARRPKKPTRAARRARRSGTDLHPRPDSRKNRAKTGPTAKRQTRPKQTSSQMPDRRLVPATTISVVKRPAGQAPKTPQHQPGRSGLVRDPHHRTGFHKVKTTPVLNLGEYGSGRHHATPVRVP
ncbi:zinc ribbon domain-containing protein [Nonomuraea sp. NPDC059194]|uniref:zinc ribbon domain-containing protein n=1 Tax=Nonomuraea sp. NPDC059194 TaxID=3346764 RepID=UPI0036920CC2